MKELIATAVLSSLLSQGSPTPHTKPVHLPEKCPAIADIAAGSLDHVSPLFGVLLGNVWVGIKENERYNTADSWTVAFMHESQQNGKATLKEMSLALGSYSLLGGPEWVADLGANVCVYEKATQSKSNAHDEAYVIAVTPSIYNE